MLNVLQTPQPSGKHLPTIEASFSKSGTRNPILIDNSRFHSAATVKTMKAFRIGLKQKGPWINMTPPIRGGKYRKLEAPEADDSDDSAIVIDSPEKASTLRKRAPQSGGSSEDGDAASAVDSGYDSNGEVNSSIKALSPDEYADWAIQQGVDFDIKNYPSVDPVTQARIVDRYRVLHQQVQDEGLYDCPYWKYGEECVRYSILFALFGTALYHQWYITAAIFLGIWWQQIMFTAHDAGHRAITHNFVVDTLIGMFIADFCCGLSIGWWKSSHNVHHIITNQTEHDPDIQNTPLFATCPSFFKSLASSYYDGFVFAWDKACEIMVPIQKYTYYPVMGLARFNLYLLSWLHVLSGKSSGLGSTKAWWIRPAEGAMMACYWFIFGYLLLWRTLPNWPIRVAFVLVSHIVTMPLHVQITLSHWGMSTSELGETESFAQKQLRTTMDVDCPKWFDFYHGGLQFQVAHHLFPRVPRHNLRRVQELAMDFAKDTGITYSILSFTDGNKKVLGRLDQVGGQVKMMLNCQKYMAETGESGLH